MIVATLAAPVSTVYVLGFVALLFLPLSIGTSLTVYLTSSVKPGKIGAGDLTTAALASGMILAYLAVLLWMNCWYNFESYFEVFPWLRGTNSRDMLPDSTPEKSKCPFTGLRPSLRCPSCHCLVHKTAFRNSERFSQQAHEVILRWDSAKAAIERATPQTLKESRAELDEALDFRGNVYFQTVTGCCIGCATWQKCFNLAPRLSLSLATASIFYAFVPWAFPEFLNIIGTWGSILKILSGSISVTLATTALLVQLRAFGRALIFLADHCNKIPALQGPIKSPPPRQGMIAYIIRHSFATPWDPLM